MVSNHQFEQFKFFGQQRDKIWVVLQVHTPSLNWIEGFTFPDNGQKEIWMEEETDTHHYYVPSQIRWGGQYQFSQYMLLTKHMAISNLSR